MNYAYNQDDSVNFITDARNVKTTFGYYPRGLVANITYDISNATGVVDTKNVSFAYDVAGNRTNMTEGGQGSVNYSYDWLSRLTSEARSIDTVGTYTHTRQVKPQSVVPQHLSLAPEERKVYSYQGQRLFLAP